MKALQRGIEQLVNKQIAEAFVFIKEESSPLRYLPMADGSLRLRSHARLSHPDQKFYEEGEDFVMDYEHGRVARTKGSRIPDGSLHPMYNISGFNHLQYPDFINREYTVYMDYSLESSPIDNRFTLANVERSGLLCHTNLKCSSGEEAVCVIYGDSISTGGEASEEDFTYYKRFADNLQSLYPMSRLRIVNKSIGGEATDGGVSRVNSDVTPLKPTLVIIGYGMNDQNKLEQGNNISVDQFENNLRYIIDTIQEAFESDILLVTPCEPNSNWQHTSGDIHLYADTIRRLGQANRIGVADAHTLWCQELKAGKTPESLLLNNINHPNDYGHWIYSCAFARMLQQ